MAWKIPPQKELVLYVLDRYDSDPIKVSVFSLKKKEYQSGLTFPPPGDLPSPGIEPASLVSPDWQMGSLPLRPLGGPHSEHSSCPNKLIWLKTLPQSLGQLFCLLLTQGDLFVENGL